MLTTAWQPRPDVDTMGGMDEPIQVEAAEDLKAGDVIYGPTLIGGPLCIASVNIPKGTTFSIPGPMVFMRDANSPLIVPEQP